MGVPLVVHPYIFKIKNTNSIMKKTFMRASDGMLCGVCKGIADYFDIDPTLVRIAWVVGSWFYGIGIILYLALWLIAPCDD